MHSRDKTKQTKNRTRPQKWREMFSFSLFFLEITFLLRMNVHQASTIHSFVRSSMCLMSDVCVFCTNGRRWRKSGVICALIVCTRDVLFPVSCRTYRYPLSFEKLHVPCIHCSSSYEAVRLVFLRVSCALSHKCMMMMVLQWVVCSSSDMNGKWFHVPDSIFYANSVPPSPRLCTDNGICSRHFFFLCSVSLISI